MNQRNSTGLPLRAMVMVLLFLGVVFLLVALKAMDSGSDDDSEQSPIATSTITSTTPVSPTESPAPAKAEVRVFNISTVDGAAEGTANRLREAEWNVVETGNLELPNVTVNTVYFSDAPGEREAADEVGKLLDAPVEPRLPEMSEVGPGVVVVVTG